MRFRGEMRCIGLQAAALGAALVAAGCNTAADDPVFVRQAAANTGAYPNLNLRAPVATTQFTPYSLAQHNATIASAHQGQSAEGAAAAQTVAQSAADQARLEALRKTHGKATVEAIESN